MLLSQSGDEATIPTTAAYTSGALCISLGSNDIYSATGGRFSLNSGALALPASAIM